MKPMQERFWLKVEKHGEDDCWPWLKYRNEDGYGKVYLAEFGKILGAHRVAYFLTHGEWPLVVGHKCDNPPCCNPAHLFDTTPKGNVEDRVAKGRPGNQTTRKLSHEQVRWFRENIGKRSVRSMAKELGVSHTVLFQIKNEGFYGDVT